MAKKADKKTKTPKATPTLVTFPLDKSGSIGTNTRSFAAGLSMDTNYSMGQRVNSGDRRFRQHGIGQAPDPATPALDLTAPVTPTAPEDFSL